MTVEEIKKRVADMGEKRASDGHIHYDNTAAHEKEDKLYLDLLKHFAHNAPPEYAELATEALKTQELDFDRWYE